MNPFRRQRPVPIPVLTEEVIIRIIREERDRLLNEHHGVFEFSPAYHTAVVAMTNRAVTRVHREMTERYGRE